jgi:hypothetical protein
MKMLHNKYLFVIREKERVRDKPSYLTTFFRTLPLGLFIKKVIIKQIDLTHWQQFTSWIYML